MLRYIILITFLFSVMIANAADKNNSNKIFYEKYLSDGRVVRVMKSSSVKMSPKPKKLYEQIGDLKFVFGRGENQTDKYSMIITDGNSEIITAWEKVIITPKSSLTYRGRDKYLDFKVHDIQMKGDRAAVFFSDKKLMLEIVGPGPDGVSRVLSSNCMVKTQSAVCPLTVINGQLLWFENGLYAVAKILIGGNAIWVLKTDKSEKDIITRISGPFNFYRIIRDKEQSPVPD